MKNNPKLIFTLAVLFMLCVVLLVFYLKDDAFNWRQSYNATGDEPYELGVLHELLENNVYQGEFSDLKQPYSESLDELDPSQKYNLIAIKRLFYPDTAEIRALLQFISKGNTLVLSSENISPLLALALSHGMDTITTLGKHLTAEEHYAYVPDSVHQAYQETDSWAVMDSIHDAYKNALQQKVNAYSYLKKAESTKSINLLSGSGQTATLSMPYKNEILEHQWMYVNTDVFSNARVLFQFEAQKLPTAVQFGIGDGQVLICSTPVLFTNYFIRKQEHFTLINELFNTIPKSAILFDDVRRFKTNWPTNNGSGTTLSQSPLSFILSQRALRWAWFTLLGTVLLFVLFRSKRKQRIIPLVKPNRNTTLAYAQLLGSLQLKEKQNNVKAQEIFQHFMQHLRARNRWHGNANEALKQKLLKLAPDLNREIEIVVHLGTMASNQHQISDQQLINLFNYTNLLIQRT